MKFFSAAAVPGSGVPNTLHWRGGGWATSGRPIKSLPGSNGTPPTPGVSGAVRPVNASKSNSLLTGGGAAAAGGTIPSTEAVSAVVSVLGSGAGRPAKASKSKFAIIEKPTRKVAVVQYNHRTYQFSDLLWPQLQCLRSVPFSFLLLQNVR